MKRIVAVLAVTGSALLVGAGVANAAPDTTCVEEGLAAAMADPASTIMGSAADPAGTVETEIACVESVIGL